MGLGVQKFVRTSDISGFSAGDRKRGSRSKNRCFAYPVQICIQHKIHYPNERSRESHRDAELFLPSASFPFLRRAINFYKHTANIIV